MAETEQPGDGGAEQTPGGSEQEATPRRTPEADGTAETELLPGAKTPGRGTAAPLGTVGDGRYRLTHRLGRGGMAEVFAAQDVRLGRTVAVKLLRPELAEDDTARLRFTREAHSVAALNHHSIVAVYDTGEEERDGESTPYIVMELVEGRTVRELLVDEEAPPVDQALIIVAGVLEALSYSHRHGIVHRDIKPANVIITTSGAVKVMDFGIARALTGAATTMTQTGMVMGTPQYLSPEQALGKAVDHRSDLYAAGCMLYELLTLRPPFVGETPLSVVYQHVQDNPVPPSQQNGRVPASLDELVLRSLAKNPDDRFQSADEFRAHLQHALRRMHGAGGAGYGAAAAAAGLAAAGAGTGGAGPEGTPSGGTAITEPLGSFGAGEERTTAMPYPVGSPYQTPAQPYPGAGGTGGGGEEGDQEPGGRNPWGWALGVVAIVLAASIGVALALSMSNRNPGTPEVTGPPAASSTPSESTTPTQTSTVQTPTRNQTATRPTETATTSPSASHSRTASPSASPSVTGSATESPTGTASVSPSPDHTPTSTNSGTNPPPTPTIRIP